jgi:hypothetical protein
VKVRVFHDMNKPLPPDAMPEQISRLQRVLPKKLSWEEALAQFEKVSHPAPAKSETQDAPAETE